MNPIWAGLSIRNNSGDVAPARSKVNLSDNWNALKSSRIRQRVAREMRISIIVTLVTAAPVRNDFRVTAPSAPTIPLDTGSVMEGSDNGTPARQIVLIILGFLPSCYRRLGMLTLSPRQYGEHHSNQALGAQNEIVS